MKTPIKDESENPVLNIVLDTLSKNKQALVFFNTKKSAEKAGNQKQIEAKFIVGWLCSVYLPLQLLGSNWRQSGYTHTCT